MEHPKIDNQAAIIRKLNDLYVMTRFKYLVQNDGGGWVTLDQRNSKKVVPFNDGMLKTHLRGRRAYGIFSGGYFSKFLTFDVDCENHDDVARWATYKIIAILMEDYGIFRHDIHVSFSGWKGYHVDLFFDRMVLVTDLQRLHTAVVASVGKLPVGKIEFRPIWSNGVKIPLGVHQGTGNRCWYLDNENLTPIEDFDYILGIKPMDATVISDDDFGLTDEQATEFEHVARTVDPAANVVSASDALQRARRILDAGRLIESGTRHTTTVILATFFNSHGWDQADAIYAIMTVLNNTPRDYFSRDSTPEHWRKETERLVGLAYDRDYKLGNADKEVNVYKSEILAVLRCGTFRTKQMAFAMLLTSKRYGRTFDFAESTGKRMIGTASNDTVGSAIKRLEKVGFIESVRRGKVDSAASKERGHVFYRPNKYKLLIDEPTETESFVTVNKNGDVIDVVKALLSADEVKRYVKRYEYESRFKAQVTV